MPAALNDERGATGLHCEVDLSATTRFITGFGPELDMAPGTRIVDGTIQKVA
jgi:hypothetical protein